MIVSPVIYLKMSLLNGLKSRNIPKFIVLCRYCSTDKAAVGNKLQETALVRVQDRMYHWLDAYENFVGLTEVKSAQEQVTEVANSLIYRSTTVFMI